MKKLAIVLVSLITALTSIGPAQAFPARAGTISTSAGTTAGTTDVQPVQYREHRRVIRRHGSRTSHRFNGRHDRRDRYSSHRRYDRYGRRHDRRHRSNGAIIGGLAAGAIIGGAIAAQNRSSSSSSCAARYRSYRASDHTYQPLSGPRRVCR